MKKMMITVVLLLFVALSVYPQTNIKGNGIYWLIGMPNVSVETKLSEHFSLSGEVVYSPWESIKGNSLKFLQFNPDIRWYPKGVFNGFYVGAYGTIQDYKMTKWNYWNRNRYQDGWGYGFGGMLGFQAILTNRWALDVYAGGGWHLGKYRGYYRNSGEMYADWNDSGEWIPYRLGIAICYRL